MRLDRRLGQIFEGQWGDDGTGIRPVATGFDRVITIGDIGWKDYEVTAEITFNSFDESRPVVGSAVGLVARLARTLRLGAAALRASVRRALSLRLGRADPLLYRLQIGYSPGPGARHDPREAD